MPHLVDRGLRLDTVNGRLFDRFVRHAHNSERARDGVTALAARSARDRIGAIIDRIEARLARQVRSRRDPARILRRRGFRALIRDVSRWTTEAYGALATDVADQVHELAVLESRWVMRVMGEELPFDFSAQVPSRRAVRRAVLGTPIRGNTVRQWMRGLGRQATADLVSGMQAGVREGETAAAIATRLRGPTGALHRAERSTRAVVDTVAGGAGDIGRSEGIAAHGEFVKRERWTAVLDAVTCPVCSGLDGSIFSRGEGPHPPAHPSCRCLRILAIKSARELGLNESDLPEIRRGAMDGKVPASTTYAQWLRRQPRAIQDEVLGPTRARLWRGGQVEIDSLRDANLRPISLEELARREGFDAEAALMETRKAAGRKAAETRAREE